jgi:hypothetical protein
MCQFISFFHQPGTDQVFVYDLEHHGDTEAKLPKGPIWREGHYLPSGEIEARVAPEDHATAKECADKIRARFPTFVEFFNFCLREIGKEHKYAGDIDLRGLTSAQGLTLPKSIGGGLDLRGLTSAEREEVERQLFP